MSMDDFLKILLAVAGVVVVMQLVEEPRYATPYYVPYFFPWMSSAFFRFPGSGFPIPRPPLGDGEGMEVIGGGGGHMGGGGFGGGHGR
jgi:hypothetical protein